MDQQPDRAVNGKTADQDGGEAMLLNIPSQSKPSFPTLQPAVLRRYAQWP